MDEHAKERQIPIILIIVGLLLHVFLAYRAVGAGHVGAMVVFLGVIAVLGTGVMVVCALVTAMITRQSFGELPAAILKLAAIYLFANGVGSLIPTVGFIITLAILFSLLVWLFELETPYAILFMVVMFFIQFAIVFMTRSIFVT